MQPTQILEGHRDAIRIIVRLYGPCDDVRLLAEHAILLHRLDQLS
jgi:hypothetical protein